MHTPQSSEHQAHKQRLLAELDEARELFERAKQDMRTARVLAADVGLNTADGSYPLNAASRRYSRALGAYAEAMKRWTDLHLQNTRPNRIIRSTQIGSDLTQLGLLAVPAAGPKMAYCGGISGGGRGIHHRVEAHVVELACDCGPQGSHRLRF